MTDLLIRPSRPTTAAPASAQRPAALWWRGALGASWAVAVGLGGLVVLVLVVWATDSRAAVGAAPAVRAALQLWLVAQHVPVRFDGASISVPPLLLTIGLLALVAHAAAVLARSTDVVDRAGVARVGLAVGLPYATLTTFVTAAATSAAVHPSPVASLLTGVGGGCGAASWGALRGSGLVRATWRALPAELRTALAGGGAALGVVTVAAGLFVAASLGIHAAAVLHGMSALGGGVVAVAALVLLDLALLPNAVAWAVGYVVGPGFAIAGSVVSARGGAPAQLPALPGLAALPAGPASSAVVAVVITAVVLAGAMAGWLVARAGHALARSLLLAGGAGLSSGVLAACLCAVAGGAAGPGAMSAVGPSPWRVGVLFAVEVAVVAAGTVGALTWRRGR